MDGWMDGYMAECMELLCIMYVDILIIVVCYMFYERAQKRE